MHLPHPKSIELKYMETYYYTHLNWLWSKQIGFEAKMFTTRSCCHYFLNFFSILMIFFWSRVSPYSRSWPWTHYVIQAGLHLWSSFRRILEWVYFALLKLEPWLYLVPHGDVICLLWWWYSGWSKEIGLKRHVWQVPQNTLKNALTNLEKWVIIHVWQTGPFILSDAFQLLHSCQAKEVINLPTC